MPRALAWATDVDTLPPDAVVERRGGYLLIRSPGNPTFYWGNLLLFDEAPRSGDGPRWEELFEREFTNAPRVEHRSFGWDRTDGEPGAARSSCSCCSFDANRRWWKRVGGLEAERGRSPPLS